MKEPRAVAASGAFVFWVNQGDAAVMCVPKAGGDPKQLASAVTTPPTTITEILVDSNDVYWGETIPGASSCGARTYVRRLAHDGTAPRQMLYYDCAGIMRMAADATYVYASLGNGVLGQILKENAASSTLVTAPQAAALSSVWSSMFFATPSAKTISRFDRGATSAVVIATDQPDTRDLAVAVDHLYWLAMSGTVMRTALPGGGAPTTLATGQSQPARIGVDDSSVYWTNAGDGTVAMVDKTGGAPRVLARNQAEPWGIAVDADGVYWTNHGDGTVWMLPRRH